MSARHTARTFWLAMKQLQPLQFRAARWLALAVALAITAAPRVAFAHAHLVRSAPAANSHLAIAPTVIQLWFSEAAEPAMTTIIVTGANGERISIGAVKADATDPLLLAAAFTAPFAAGTYTVSWRTVAKDDGHPSVGKFSFVVDGDAALPATPIAGAGTITTASDSTQPVAASNGSVASDPVDAMDVEAPSYVLARWLNFVALIAAIGVIAFRFLVLPRVASKRDAGGIGTDATPIFDSFVDRAVVRAASLGLIASMAVLVAAVWRLYAERAVVGGSVSVVTILQSNWGRIWHVQLAAALVACIAFALARRAEKATRGQPSWVVAGLAVIILGASSAFSGHAMAAPQYRNVSVALDILHVLAAGGWIGGLLALSVVGVPVALSVGNAADAPGRLPLVARLVNAFSPVALTLASVVVVSGVIAAKLRLGLVASLFHSTYGTVLMVKLGFVLLVIAGGAFNWLRMRAALSSSTGGSTVSKFRGSALFELVAAILVIAATAVLVATQPPIH